MLLVLGLYSYSKSAIDGDGRKIRDVGFIMKGSVIQFEICKDEFAYILGKDKQ